MSFSSTTMLKRINVLIYNGAGTSPQAIRQTTATLRQHLSPYYAVSTLAAAQLLQEPWPSSCALLVIPGGADTNYCRELNGLGTRRIRAYVEAGGKLMGFCAGGYFSSARCEFEVGRAGWEVAGPRELALFPGICRGLAFSGFVYGSEAGARAVRLDVESTAFASADGSDEIPTSLYSYYNGGGVFVDADKLASEGVEILARFADPVEVDACDCGIRAAIVHCRVDQGAAILTGPHPEYSGSSLDRNDPSNPNYGDLIDSLLSTNKQRTRFVRACLLKLGLRVAHEMPNSVASPSPLHLSCARVARAGSILDALRKHTVTAETKDGREYIRGENDTFMLEIQGESPSSAVHNTDSIGSSADYDGHHGSDSIKTLIFHTEAHPSVASTPDFDHAIYYNSLDHSQRARHKPSNNPFAKSPSEYGNTLIHSSLLSSTSTILDKNYILLPHLPAGTVVQATTQFAGRGRGTNVWLSPPGSLLFSVIVPHSLGISNNGRAPVVLVQYLAAMAVIQGVQQYGLSTTDAARWEAVAESVRLKWPNDIYAKHPDSTATDGSEYVKIGGILVTTSYFGGHYTLVVGIGLNVNNADGCPTTSILQIARRLGVNADRPTSVNTATHDEASTSFPKSDTTISIERLQASILVALEDLHLHFCANGWDHDLERMYHTMWLHTDQLVTLRLEDEEQQAEQQHNSTYVSTREPLKTEWRARIKGITADQGMLIAEEELDEPATPGQRARRFELRSDMNSFDFMQGLVRKKM